VVYNYRNDKNEQCHSYSLMVNEKIDIQVNTHNLAPVAKWISHQTSNLLAVGSSPTRGAYYWVEIEITQSRKINKIRIEESYV
jgi:hypothetical protein